MPTGLNYSGLVIAGIGFFLTRFTVTLAIYETPIPFYLAGVAPLVLGLGLAAFGVALTVADVDPRLVRTAATWCIIGFSTMLVLVLLTLLGSSEGSMPHIHAIRSRTYLANFLIGGSLGGTLTGLYAARDRFRRESLELQTNRLKVLNRLLRHEVLNDVTAIRGYAAVIDSVAEKAESVITDRSSQIESTIEDVKYLTQSAGREAVVRRPLDVTSCLERSVETVRAAHPDAEISVEPPAGDPEVQATDRLERVFTQLLENAVTYADDPTPTATVHVETQPDTVRICVSDEAGGLPESQAALLERGAIEEFDDPTTGFGLNVVRLLVESFQGRIETEVDDEGSTVTVVLPRSNPEVAPLRASPDGLTGIRPAIPQLLVVFVAALVAGVGYGIAAESVGGSVSIIGVLYGVENPIVGWITHQFHSVVFGFVYLGLLTIVPRARRQSLRICVGVALGWALILWLFAAGMISPIWLRLLGIPASLPSLSEVTFVAHMVWALVMGLLTPVGLRYVLPWFEARLQSAT
jgi:two-component system OmpR family sensor kinase